MRAASTTPPSAGHVFRIACIMIAGVAGSAGYMVVPLVVAALRHAGATPEMLLGMVGSADPAGMFIGAGLALLRGIRTAPRRAAIAAMAVSLACNAGSLTSPPISLLIALRLLSGAGGGIALALTLSALGRTAQPDRNFAIITLAQMIFGMIAASLTAAGSTGLPTIYRTLFVTQMLGVAACWAFPRLVAAPVRDRMARDQAALDPRLIGFTLLGNLLSAAGFLVLWANIEALARRAGMNPAATVVLLDVGLIGGFAGTLLTALIDGRNRRVALATILFGLGLLGTLLVEVRFGAGMLFPAVFLFQIAPAAVCYGFGAISDADPSGRLPIVHILAVKAGFAIAPITGSALVSAFGLWAVTPAAFIATLGAMLCYRQQIRRAERLTGID